MTILETERILLREFTDSDLDVLAAMMADQEQMSLYPRPRTRDETKVWIDRNIGLYRELGYGFWRMEALKGGDFFGYCGIRPLTLEGVQEVEMGWHTRKEFWGQGLATESAAACRDLAFTRFAVTRLVATIDPTNEASLRVAKKIGMRPERNARLDGWPCVVYSIERTPSPNP